MNEGITLSGIFAGQPITISASGVIYSVTVQGATRVVAMPVLAKASALVTAAIQAEIAERDAAYASALVDATNVMGASLAGLLVTQSLFPVSPVISVSPGDTDITGTVLDPTLAAQLAAYQDTIFIVEDD